MKAILIDPWKCEVSEIEYDGNWQSISKHLMCDLFTCVYLPDLNGDVMYLDDEGLYVEDQQFFLFEGAGTPLAGYALILGSDGEGGSVDVATSVDRIAYKTIFNGNMKVVLG
jgi:hypothetical protein